MIIPKPIIRFFYLALLPLILVSCDKYELTDDQQITFLKYYGTTTQTEGVSLAANTAGYLIIGNQNDLRSNSDIVLINTDKYGNTKKNFNSTIGNSDENNAFKLVEVDDGNFLLCATTNSSVGTNLMLSKLDPFGQVIWTTTTDNSNFESLGRDAAYNNGKYIVVGYTKESENSINQPYVTIWSATDGSLVLERAINSTGSQEFTSVTRYNNRIFIAGHAIGRPGNPDDWFAAWVVAASIA